MDSNVIPRVTLAVLSIVGFFCTVRFMMDNGTVAEIRKTLAVRGPLLQGPDQIFFLTRWTGIRAFDEHVCIVMVFWQTLLEGSLPSATLSAAYFYAQHMSLWMLLMLEAYRVGNAWTILSFITLIGLIGENLGMATVAPSYFALHLASSPTVRGANSYPPTARRTMLLVHPTELQALPWSVIFGYGVPTLLALYCDFKGAGPFYQMKQFWILLRQIGPMLVGILQLSLSIVLPPANIPKKQTDERNQKVMKALEQAFGIISFIGMASHIIATALVCGSQMLPNIFANGYKSFFDPIRIILPPQFWSDIQIPDVANGVLFYFQWSNIITYSSVIIWALALNRHVAHERSQGLGWKLVKTAGSVVLLGPVATSVNLVMERDQSILYQKTEVDENMKSETISQASAN